MSGDLKEAGWQKTDVSLLQQGMLLSAREARMYHIDINRRVSLVSVKLAGLLTVEEVTRYIGDMEHRFVQEGIIAGYLLMIDTTDAMLQTQEVIRALQQQIVQFPKARRIAMVNGSSLARMQIRRVMTQDYMRLCATHAEGMAWLMNDDQSDEVTGQTGA